MGTGMHRNVQYSCYDEKYERRVEGAVIGSKDDVLKWMKTRFGRARMAWVVSPDVFLNGKDCTEYLIPGGRVVLGEIKKGDRMMKAEAGKIVAKLSAMTQKDMVKATTEDEEFRRLHEELLAGGWAILAAGMKRHKDGKIVCKMRLVRGDDPEWLRLKPTW